MFIGRKYPETKEHFLIGSVLIGAAKKKKADLSLKTPHVKVRVSRGKSYDPTKKIKGPEDVVKAFREYLNKNQIEGQEQFLVMYLTRNNAIIGIYPHTKGGMTSSIVDIKLVAAAATQLAAEAVITCHNHPSGELTPSEADRQLARNLSKALDTLGISLLDNIILTKNSFTSF